MKVKEIMKRVAFWVEAYHQNLWEQQRLKQSLGWILVLKIFFTEYTHYKYLYWGTLINHDSEVETFWSRGSFLFQFWTVNVFAKVKKLAHSTGGPKPAPLDDVMKVISVANQDQKDLIMTYLLTGARKSEILTMTWNDIDLKAKTYKLHTRKTGNKLIKTTLHAMPEVLFEIITRKNENRKPGIEYVFYHRYYSHSRKEYVEDRYMSLNKFTKRLCEKAVVPLFTMHQFRHLAATLLKENGASLSEMQLFLRHDEQKTTELYAGHLDNSTVKQSEYLGNFWSGKFAEAAGA